MRHLVYTVIDELLRISGNIYVLFQCLTVTFVRGGQTYKSSGVKFSQDFMCQQLLKLLHFDRIFNKCISEGLLHVATWYRGTPEIQGVSV